MKRKVNKVNHTTQTRAYNVRAAETPLTVEGTAGEGTPVSFTRRYTDVQAGQLYHFTVKGESLSAPDIEWVGHDTSQRYEANDELEAQIVVTAAGIRAFTVEIISEEVLTPEVLDAVGLAPELDLVSPGDYKEPLEGLGFPTGEKVVGQTSVSFDISDFMPLIPLLGTGDSDFRLTVTDNEGQTTVASIMVHSTNGEAPEPEGPEEEYPGGDAKPLEPPHAGQPYPGGDAKPIHNTQKITTIR